MNTNEKVQTLSGQLASPDAQNPGTALARVAKHRPGKFRLYKRDGAGREIPQYIRVASASRGSGDAGWTLNPDLPRESHYYFKFEFRGKRYPRCLETNEADKAQVKAKDIAKQIEASVIQQNAAALEATKLRHAVSATVHDLFTRYDASIVTAAEDTRGQNKHALLLILARVHYGADTADNRVRALHLPITVLNGSLVKSWFLLAKKAVETDPALRSDPARQLSLQTTANSRMAQARSLFAPKAVAEYQETQDGARPAVWHECLAEFHAAFNKFKFDGLSRSREYNPPNDKIIEATLDAWEKLESRNLFLAVGHELAFGLRAGETGQALWNWWQTRCGYPVLDGSAFVKNKTMLIQVRALDPFFTFMRLKIETRAWRGQPGDFIIGGSSSYRDDGIEREVSHWMRSLGWATKKTNHALRAYAGSQIAMKFGIHAAQGWLRHSTVKVTEDHYTHFCHTFKPADPDQLPARWASAPQTFEPRVYSAAG